MVKYLGCAWNAIALGLLVLGLLSAGQLIRLSGLLAGVLVIIGVVVTELVASWLKESKEKSI